MGSFGILLPKSTVFADKDLSKMLIENILVFNIILTQDFYDQEKNYDFQCSNIDVDGLLISAIHF